MNVADTEAYRLYRQKQETIFCPKNLMSNLDDGAVLAGLGGGYELRSRLYQGKTEWVVRGSENELLDENGRLLYTWRCIDVNCEFCQLVVHANGCKYLIFRRDLYGYSVLKLDTMQDFHYIPSDSFPVSDDEKFRETFIWTSVAYDCNSNLLAVEGCYWACPSSIVVLDFTDPMTEHSWVDTHSIVDPEYDLYNDLDFSCFEGESLVVEGQNDVTDQRDVIRIPFPELRRVLEDTN